MFEISSLNNTGYTDLIVFAQSTIELVVALTGLLAVIFLIYAGFTYIISAGGEKAEKAQKMMIYTVLGLIIAFISPLIVRFILENIIQSV
ncbi:hypothetical protein H6763_03090 [Candidatus Nomurabacteria bacterium]|uniref:Uncharacterized protein n=1 Tax=Candidatus Dojkabacteria bacterium TaxID=2099670 RepID=A0A955KYA9_9BACT|nr:hypothetical protein [Candidatus Dojkabacteria bacterium]MCB9789470.1 hypothetical protein [Candidatus Nomurabacteria bacterium]MCB9803792.1 hypothetical protein [Candidatus Nomurabacteria bacterium]